MAKHSYTCERCQKELTHTRKGQLFLLVRAHEDKCYQDELLAGVLALRAKKGA